MTKQDVSIIRLRHKTNQLEHELRKVHPQIYLIKVFLLALPFFVSIIGLIIFWYIITKDDLIPASLTYFSGPALLLVILFIYQSYSELKRGLASYMRAKEAFNDGTYALEKATEVLSKIK